ncbi:MAG: bifunctional oligoribonuclease/PAP phosphatase NrnA [candidate division Zixibacteria bacterium]|nr:bifunctional oligoribonuclease/PAP phosphatase NrnA [candidate division Zixibacteria bacterium]
MNLQTTMTIAKNQRHNSIDSIIRGARSILVLSHREPDGDSLGSQLALARHLRSLGKQVAIVNEGAIPDKYRFLPDIDTVIDYDSYDGVKRFDLALFLECGKPERAGRAAEFITDQTQVINIDHHPDNTGYGDVALVNDKASSVGEILYEYFMDIGYKLDEASAVQLYTAILTDTGRFRYNSTTRRTMEVAGHLLELGVHPRQVCDLVYYAMPPSTLRLIGHILSHMEFFENDRICLMYLDQEMLDVSRAGWDEVDGLAEYSLYGRDTLIGAFLKEVDAQTTRVSLRSRTNINVSELAHKYGGGGHIKASGFTVSLPLRDAGRKLLDDLREMIHATV